MKRQTEVGRGERAKRKTASNMLDVLLKYAAAFAAVAYCTGLSYFVTYFMPYRISVPQILRDVNTTVLIGVGVVHMLPFLCSLVFPYLLIFVFGFRHWAAWACLPISIAIFVGLTTLVSKHHLLAFAISIMLFACIALLFTLLISVI